MDTRIYIATHKQSDMYDGDGYIPLHVGREGKDDLGYIGDNTGDNISIKNPNYCELTGMYWMWKNVQCDIIGLCHYRRYMVNKEKKVVTVSEFEDILKEYDMIIAATGLTGNEECLWDQYKHGHYEKDIETVRDVIRDLYPEYYDAFMHGMQSSLASFTNMIVAPKKTYDAYCEWLFNILFEVEKRIDISEYDNYQARVFGFLSERLLHPWIMMQDIKVYEMMYAQV